MGRPHRGGPIEARTNHGQSGRDVYSRRKEYLVKQAEMGQFEILEAGENWVSWRERAKAMWLTCSDEGGP